MPDVLTMYMAVSQCHIYMIVRHALSAALITFYKQYYRDVLLLVPELTTNNIKDMYIHRHRRRKQFHFGGGGGGGGW